MALTTIPNNLVLKHWAKDAWRAGFEQAYFSRFMGESEASIIHVKTELQKGKGDSIIIPLIKPLVGAGVTGDNWLEGNEEALSFLDYKVTIDQLRHAVRLKGRFEEQKTQINMRQQAKQELSDWLGRKVDDMIFDALSTNPSADRTVFGGGATVEGGITPTDKFDCAVIGKAKRLATADRNFMVKPVRINGRDTYVMVIDQWQARDLTSDPEWVQAQLHANIDGKDNPIFTGALGMYNGVVIHEHNGVKRTATGDNGAVVGHALFLGAQAAVFAVGEEPTWHEDTFDYGNQWGVEFGRIFGVGKPEFEYHAGSMTDFGVINVLTSSAED